MSQEKYVHGHHVTYEKNAEEGVNYLNIHLDSEYAKVFFSYAQHHRSVPFEDQNGRKYLMAYENDKFFIERK